MKRLLFLLSAAPVALAVLGCGGGTMDELPCLTCSIEPAVIPGPLVNYGDENYETVIIGSQIWFNRNLNYEPTGADANSKCYGNDPANCVVYGRLYDWATAMALDQICNNANCSPQISVKHKGICPVGWHIPSGDEWNVLMTSVGGYSAADKHLKAASGWSSGNGTDAYGFAALPGGRGIAENFFSIGSYGYWWSATEYGEDSAYLWYMDGGISGHAYWYKDRKLFLFSVRCVAD